MPVETNGLTQTIGLFGDDDNTTRIWKKSTQPLVKTGTVFDLSEPFVAHEIQWQTLNSDGGLGGLRAGGQGD